MKIFKLFGKIHQLYEYAKAVRSTHKKPIINQFIEATKLYFSQSKIGFSEYYEYGIYDDEKIKSQHKSEMIGWRTSAYIDKVLNDGSWRSTANNKLLCCAILNGLNIPAPKNLAIYSVFDIGKNEILLRDPDSLRNFLSREDIYPIFVKPVQGTYGRDAYAVLSYDPSTERLVLKNGGYLEIKKLIEKARFLPYGGLLFQPLLKPHPILKQTCGNRLSTVRLILIRQEEKYEVFMAFLKIPVGNNMTDNFSHGATGNMLGWVDIINGRIVRVIPKLGINRIECEIHPDTQQKIIGLALPDWEKAKNYCLKAAGVLNGLWLQHWDIAFTDEGPIILEVNTEADLGVPQCVGYTGILNEKMRKALELKQKFNIENRMAIQSRR
ncbi:sugar-transfer associated ATP-grasp domain-containing protein [Methylomagnum sp.]